MDSTDVFGWDTPVKIWPAALKTVAGPIDITDRLCHLPFRAGPGGGGAYRPVVRGYFGPRRHRLRAEGQPGCETLAITAFVGLVNSFVVSLIGLIPKTSIGEPALIMAVISVFVIVRLERRVRTGRNPIVLAIALSPAMDQIGVFGVAAGRRMLTVMRRIAGLVITVELRPAKRAPNR